MIRHPLLCLAELGTALLVTLVAQLGLLRPLPRPEPVHFTLALMGEHERSTGEWEGVDLLTHPDTPVQRFQLALQPNHPVQVTVDQVGPSGLQRLFPPVGKTGQLKPGVSYALPGPRTFYEVEGSAQLRVTVLPLKAAPSGQTPLALPQTGEASLSDFRLSDGAPFRAVEQGFAAQGASHVQLTVNGFSSKPP